MNTALEGRTYVVVGAGRGIGRLLAVDLAARGANLVLAARTRADLDRVAGELGTQRGAVHVCPTDVADHGSVVALAAFASEVGEVAGSVNCAGVLGPVGRIDQVDVNAWRVAVTIDLVGTASCCAAFAPLLAVAGGGSIVNLSGGGIGGPSPPERISAYASAKAGVVVLTEVLARELAPLSVRVNAVAAGPGRDGLHGRSARGWPRGRGPELFERTVAEQADPEPTDALIVPWCSSCWSPRSAGVTGRFLSASGTRSKTSSRGRPPVPTRLATRSGGSTVVVREWDGTDHDRCGRDRVRPDRHEASPPPFLMVATRSCVRPGGRARRGAGRGVRRVRSRTSAEEALATPDVDLVIVATPHRMLAPLACSALDAGSHVLVEKPGAIDVAGVRAIADRARRRSNCHRRIQPPLPSGIAGDETHRRHGDFGRVMFIRARYGHGGRVGYERELGRAQRERSGGGELIDQGIHLIDLTRFLAGDATLAFGELRTSFWDMDVEDNAFLALRCRTAFAWLARVVDGVEEPVLARGDAGASQDRGRRPRRQLWSRDAHPLRDVARDGPADRAPYPVGAATIPGASSSRRASTASRADRQSARRSPMESPRSRSSTRPTEVRMTTHDRCPACRSQDLALARAGVLG